MAIEQCSMVIERCSMPIEQCSIVIEHGYVPKTIVLCPHNTDGHRKLFYGHTKHLLYGHKTLFYGHETMHMLIERCLGPWNIGLWP